MEIDIVSPTIIIVIYRTHLFILLKIQFLWRNNIQPQVQTKQSNRRQILLIKCNVNKGNFRSSIYKNNSLSHCLGDWSVTHVWLWCYEWSFGTGHNSERFISNDEELCLKLSFRSFGQPLQWIYVTKDDLDSNC